MSYNRGKKVNKKNQTMTSKPFSFQGYEVVSRISTKKPGIWKSDFYRKDGTYVGNYDLKYDKYGDGHIHSRTGSEELKDIDSNTLFEKVIVQVMLDNTKWYEMNPLQYGFLKGMQLKNTFA